MPGPDETVDDLVLTIVAASDADFNPVIPELEVVSLGCFNRDPIFAPPPTMTRPGLFSVW